MAAWEGSERHSPSVPNSEELQFPSVKWELHLPRRITAGTWVTL